jgi:Protein of unknown function (DUF1631)
MSDTISPVTITPATDADGMLLLSAPEADALLRKCFEMIKEDLHLLVETSIETTNDLFEANEYVKEDAVLVFRGARGQWLARCDKALDALFEKRMRGERRKGRRVDHDASIATLRVLNAFDQEQQAALIRGSFNLFRRTRRELTALDLRVSILLRDARPRDIDNPFSPGYLLDAMGLTSRELFSDPRIWRPLLVRLIADTTPGINSAYIRVNRYLAGRQVLPEIKAELRARSELRPADDSELLPVFMRLIKEAGPSAANELLALNVAVPVLAAPSAETERAAAAFAKPYDPVVGVPSMPPAPSDAAPNPPPAAPAGPSPQPPPQALPPAAAGPVPVPVPVPVYYVQAIPDTTTPPSAATPGAGVPMGATAAILVGGDIHSLRAAGLQPAPWPPSSNPYALDLVRGVPAPAALPSDGGFGLPQLDPMLALGSLASAVAALDRWQHIDPGGAIPDSDAAAATASDVSLLPLNRIPYIRAAIADRIINSTDKITIDVIGLLFDYIFRDPSIPESLRNLFSRLQVPILKTALVDRSFFSDKKHPARRLLDHLALAAIGALGDAGYRTGFKLIAAGVIDEVCRDFKVDVAVFDQADARLQEFVDAEQRKALAALDQEVATALSAEESEADRSHVRALIRDKLAGHDLPFDIRSFSETTWADYLTSLRVKHGMQSSEWNAAVQTLDDLLWSITVKERTAQKARLAKMVPALIRSLRNGGAAVKVGDDRMKPFLDAVYQLHMAAIRPEVAKTTADAGADEEPEIVESDTVQKIGNVHDFVTEMVAGTWIGFKRGDTIITARLSWVSPLRSKYIFTSRARSRAIVLTPEELAWRLGAGKATLVVEPVPLFDRAVSAALDSFAKKAPEPAQAAA